MTVKKACVHMAVRKEEKDSHRTIVWKGQLGGQVKRQEAGHF
jgi:hypothetical protein